jgi:hypothetical protein
VGIDGERRPLAALQAQLLLIETPTAAGRATDARDQLALVAAVCSALRWSSKPPGVYRARKWVAVTVMEMLMRVGLATGLGIAIGVERQWRSRMAGLQTMALVSKGAALFLILGAYTFREHTDPTRVAAQIVTGIGFLGAASS